MNKCSSFCQQVIAVVIFTISFNLMMYIGVHNQPQICEIVSVNYESYMCCEHICGTCWNLNVTLTNKTITETIPIKCKLNDVKCFEKYTNNKRLFCDHVDGKFVTYYSMDEFRHNIDGIRAILVTLFAICLSMIVIFFKPFGCC